MDQNIIIALSATIQISGLPAHLVDEIVKENRFENPIYIANEQNDRSNWDTPEYIDLRRASATILPPGATPALPEAFLTFPHLWGNCRMNPQKRRDQLKNPPKIIHDPISLKELKRQLVEKSPSIQA